MRKSNRSVILGLLVTIGAACWYDAQVDSVDGWWRSTPPSGAPAAAPPKPIETGPAPPPKAFAIESEKALDLSDGESALRAVRAARGR